MLLYPRQTILSTLGVNLASWIQIFNPKPLVYWSIKQLKIINNSNIFSSTVGPTLHVRYEPGTPVWDQGPWIDKFDLFEIELILRIQWYISESRKTSLTRGWVLKCWLWLSIVDDMCNPKILSHVLVLGYNSNSDLETYSIEIIYKLYMLQRLKKYS